MLLVACWLTFLGPIVFFSLFLPATVIAILQLAHFNWSTHNAAKPAEGFHPVNLDEGFFWIGNRLWFGIYYHANHHKFASLFNPRHFDAHHQARTRARRAGSVLLARRRVGVGFPVGTRGGTAQRHLRERLLGRGVDHVEEVGLQGLDPGPVDIVLTLVLHPASPGAQALLRG